MEEQEVELSKKAQERLDRLNSAKGRKNKKLVTYLIVAIIIAGAIYSIVLLSQRAEENKPGEAVPELGRNHVLPGVPVEYNSNPPTSGDHLAAPANWGIYEVAPPDEQLVHNLEHGGIWISYQDPADTELVEQLKELANDLRGQIVLAPRPANDSRIAVAAWGRLLKLDEFDEGQIEDFFKTFVNKGPEAVPFDASHWQN